MRARLNLNASYTALFPKPALPPRQVAHRLAERVTRSHLAGPQRQLAERRVESDLRVLPGASLIAWLSHRLHSARARE